MKRKKGGETERENGKVSGRSGEEQVESTYRGEESVRELKTGKIPMEKDNSGRLEICHFSVSSSHL